MHGVSEFRCLVESTWVNKKERLALAPEGVLEEVLQSEFDLEVGLQTAPGFAIDLPEYFELVWDGAFSADTVVNASSDGVVLKGELVHPDFHFT